MPTLTAESGDGCVRLSWDDIAERGTDPVTQTNDFEGYRIYRATDPEFRDPRVITTGTGSGPIGNGEPIAQFDLIDSRRGFSDQTVEGVSYYLGKDTGIQHTWTDTTVTNGQQYYYAVCAYDYGSDSLGFYPSENAIAVAHTPRGGVVLPMNVVEVRPEPKVPGFVPAATEEATHVAGDGVGSVALEIVNSNLGPDGHLFGLSFTAVSPESIRASAYALRDSTAHATLFRTGRDLNAAGVGPVGDGLLPLVRTLKTVQIDSARSGFDPGGPTSVRLKVDYLNSIGTDINLRRTGYPNDLTIAFSDAVEDTGLDLFPIDPHPAKFRVTGHPDAGDLPMDFRFQDKDGDGTLSRADEYIDIVSYTSAEPSVPHVTWRVQLDTTSTHGSIQPPGRGDVYQLRLKKPFGTKDVFVFRTHGQRVDEAKGIAEGPIRPYVVPNPYVGSASFEPERFAISGRGERRIEFRGLPKSCTIRIYTVHGDLVQTLTHDGSANGFVAWNLRTRDNLDVAPGLYVFQVDGGPYGRSIGKFAIIK
jgi:hypothetical protein